MNETNYILLILRHFTHFLVDSFLLTSFTSSAIILLFYKIWSFPIIPSLCYTHTERRISKGGIHHSKSNTKRKSSII